MSVVDVHLQWGGVTGVLRFGCDVVWIVRQRIGGIHMAGQRQRREQVSARLDLDVFAVVDEVALSFGWHGRARPFRAASVTFCWRRSDAAGLMQ
jgi:hypothetical protein